MNQMYLETTTKNVDKVKRYGWSIENVPGRFELINKTSIRVDDTYQRDGSPEKVSSITKKWNWIAFGVITVAQRNGKYFVIDGQHRLLAALRRSDVKEVPCLVFRTDTSVEEAKGFLAINTGRKPLTAVDTFKAALMSGDTAALHVDKFLKRHQLSVSKSGNNPSTVRAIGVLQKFAKEDPEKFDIVMDFMVQLHGMSEPMTDQVIKGMWEINKRVGDGLLDQKLRARILAVGVKEIKEAILSTIMFRNKSIPGVWAEGILMAVNAGKRGKKYTL